MKVLLLAPANNVHTKKWLDYYNSIGIEVMNISLENHKDSTETIPWENVSRVYLNLKLNHKISYLFTVSRLKKIIRKWQPDLIHSHYASSYGLIGALTGFNPYILSVWGSDIYDFPNKNMMNRIILQYALKKADYICSTSPALELETKKYIDENKPLSITPFGVDIDQFKPNPEEKVEGQFRIGIAKGMEPKYGIEYLLKGFKLFLEELGPERQYVRLQLAGDGPYFAKYRKMADDLEISGNVDFLGRIAHEDVPGFISSLQIFVISSLIESFGVSAVEAQACGVPVVATNVGGLPEVVLDGKTGYLIPSKDPQALAEKLLFLYKDSSEREKLGRNGREHVLHHYDWEENSKRMIDLYNKIVKKEK
ncbi:glycosyltransferase [Bacillus sp. es.034]|uniref:glycosyltransferase n=1 Tax=Bacillus sp. es.034 TaxID=1761763 RepID=UPI000BF8203C|nr:glycosyltransferase [Bacillus sp. es.034]PFG04427.1 glycosyltransferase involved in cell wall biosynthesis [Bacillus sp. es.034]